MFYEASDGLYKDFQDRLYSCAKIPCDREGKGSLKWTKLILQNFQAIHILPPPWTNLFGSQLLPGSGPGGTLERCGQHCGVWKSLFTWVENFSRYTFMEAIIYCGSDYHWNFVIFIKSIGSKLFLFQVVIIPDWFCIWKTGWYWRYYNTEYMSSIFQLDLSPRNLEPWKQIKET